MAGNITSADAIYMLAIGIVFPVPFQLQGFSADDIFDTEEISPSEVSMGVDGLLSGGFVFVPIAQTIRLQADSSSNALFDGWYAAQQVAKTIFRATATVVLPSIGTQWSLFNGVLTRYKPLPDAQKVLRARTFGITWQGVVPAPVV